ncbi:acetylxylan esterase [Calycomorphotria hydatis]|uniref:Alpha/beta hydrolase family protein n=1 Tax=Calycomorphotria hydatis TaxID=2528027 RepID=A0A517T695_9PLAN|nr:acetylxylan esterase [Calycomorphotria hydatis]QDT63890.1 Alpha/beta hydrolase family protein [Calycomorphotria hydatis]
MKLRFAFCLMMLCLAVNISASAAEDSSPAPLPASTPWNLEELKQAPEYEWLEDDPSGVRSLLYVNEPYQGKPTRVFAYYATPGLISGDPSVDKDLPAMVLIHGGGGTAFREWVELWAKRGYAAIAMDLAGYQPLPTGNPHKKENRERLPDGGPDQSHKEKFLTIDEPVTEQWTYHAVAAAVRAHSLIRSFPEVDASKTAVTGISWGGYLTCIVAGVDDRFHAAVPVYGCGFLHENSTWLGQFARMTPEQHERWVTLWDPSSYLPSVAMPILFVNGTNDFAYPLDSYMKSYDAVHVSKAFRITVKMGHSHPSGWNPEEIGRFIDHHLLGKPGLLTIGEPEVRDGKIFVSVAPAEQAESAELHVATDDEAINKHDWSTQPAKIEGDTITAPVPTADTKVWFVTARDKDGMIVSSRTMFPPSQSAE